MASDKESPSTRLRRRFGGVLYNGAPPRAARLLVEPIAGRSETGIRFAIDRRFEGEVRVDWTGLPSAPTGPERRALDWSLAALVAQHALPVEVHSDPTMGAPAAATRDLLKMLYDIRQFCDETEPRAVPALQYSDTAPAGSEGSRSRVLLMLSGGFDSTVTALILRDAGYDVHALHVTVNRHVERAEERAAIDIARVLEIPLHKIDLRFPDQERVGRYYSRSFGQYPFYNSIPHGRDFPLAVIGAITARHLGCGTVAFGHEKESRTKVIQTAYGPVHRHDAESSFGRSLVQRYLDESMGPGLDLSSPVAGLSIYRVRRMLLEQRPDLARLVQSCFWSRGCGRCLKCTSTYTMQRHLGVTIVAFDANPFSDPDDLDMALFARPDRPTETLGYGPQMHYAMCRIVDEGVVGPDDYWLREFVAHGYADVKRRWRHIEDICLNVEATPEVPDRIAQAVQKRVRP